MDTLLGIDLGTTGCKAAIYSPEGDLLGESYLEFTLIKPKPGVVEQDATEWWALTREAIRRSVRAASVAGGTVRALSVSSQGISFVPVDERGEPLSNAISWLDTRATTEAEIIGRRHSEADLFDITGKRASPVYVLPKLLWLRDHRPDLYHSTYRFLMAHDYLLLKFAGQFVTDHSMASGTLLYDISRQDWSPKLLEDFDIAAEKLPEVKWSGTPTGMVKPEVADALGLSRTALVAVGGQDQKCAALGAGIRPGVATISLGTAAAVSCLVDHPLLDPERRIPIFPFVLRDYWDLEGAVGTAGGALRWLREALFPGTEYVTLDRMAATSPPGAHGVCFYPHLAGASSPHWRADVWGAFLGLSLATGPQDIVRGVLEGVCFQIRENLEAMESTGIAIDETVLFGGGARSALWAQMISDVTGKPTSALAEVDVANWGACVLAGMGAGLFGGNVLGLRAHEAARTRWLPRSETADRYQEVYHCYRLQEQRLLEPALPARP